ncbi:hypothetical protein B0H19DRAFT_964674 [Mycena capillaripes]|nr:hypothetical protein B0H19DRAFT_964674 [Mycena capillaripes]
MKPFFCFVLLLSLGLAHAALNVPCIGGGLPPGVGICILIHDCAAAGGTSLVGLCPSDIPNLRCCVKAPCAPGGGGICRFNNTCAGTSLTGFCPGPNNFKCCV